MSLEKSIERNFDNPVDRSYDKIGNAAIGKIHYLNSKIDTEGFDYNELRRAWLELYTQLNIAKSDFEVWEITVPHNILYDKINSLIEFVRDKLSIDKGDTDSKYFVDKQNYADLVDLYYHKQHDAIE